MLDRVRATIVGLVVVLGLFGAGQAQAVDCAFEDVNDNGVFDGGDVIVPDAAWIGGAPFATVNPFVVPAGCDKVLATVPLPSQGVRVTAAKITFLGSLDYLPPGGRGVVFIAVGDLIVTDALIRAGGLNQLPIGDIAVAQKAVALVAGGTCTFTRAQIEGNRPVQDTRVGIRCGGDATFVSSKVLGSRVNIQSTGGSILASGSGLVGFSLATLCDQAGNNNGVLDAGDFPCTLNLGGVVNFPDANALANACLLQGHTPNTFISLNDPLIMIAGAGAGHDLDVRGASIVGRFRVVLAAEDGSLLLQNAVIDHGEQLGLVPPGGARTFLFADPTLIARGQVDREDFTGPSFGSINIAGACLKSSNPIVFGTGASVLGVGAAGCAQFPGNFVAVLSQLF